MPIWKSPLTCETVLYRWLDWRVARLQRARAPRAVSSELPRFTRHSIRHFVPGDDAAADPLFCRPGQLNWQGQQQAVAWIGQQVQAQASLLAFIDVFWTLMLVSAAAVPLALLLRKVKLGGATHLGH
jgi:hypothetical protein